MRGSASAGRERSASSPACSRRPAAHAPRTRSRAWATLRCSSATSGTTSLAASVGRGGADVGDQVEQRLVGLVADRGDDRRADGVHRADQRLVGERQQVLDRAAAAGDHDHVDGRVAVEPLHGLDHLGRRARALHRGVRDLEGDRRPAAPGVLEHVALGGAVGGGDQADGAGQEGQRPLELGREQPLGGEQLAAALEPGEQLAEADHPDVAGVERDRAAVGVVRRLGVDDDARALDHAAG